MGVFNDLFRIGKGGVKQLVRTDWIGSIRESAKIADQWAGHDPNLPMGTHGASAANPFTNMGALTNSLPASGRVRSLAPTGGEVSGNPVYSVLIEVTIDGQQPYEANYQTVIAAAALPSWQPGAILPFRVSRNDRHSLMVG